MEWLNTKWPAIVVAAFWGAVWVYYWSPDWLQRWEARMVDLLNGKKT